MSFSYEQPYIVIGAFIVRDGKVLLVQENHLPDAGKWNIPAGKLDYGENPLEAVKREVFEEAGLTFEPQSILGLHSIHRKDVPAPIGTTHALRIVFTGDATGEPTNTNGEVEDGKPEIAQFAWLTPDEVLAMDDKTIRYHDLKDYMRDYLAGTTYPLALITHLVQE